MNKRAVGDGAVSGALWTAMANIVSQTLSFLVFVLLARLMAPADFGLITLSMAVILLVTAISGLGLGKLLVQLENPGQPELDTAFALSTLTGMVLALTLWLAAPLLADAVDTPELAAVMRALVCVVILKALGVVPQGLLAREFRFRAIALRTIVSLVIGGAAGIVLALNGYAVWALVAQEIVKALVSLIGLWLACRWTPGTALSLARGCGMLRQSLHIMGSEISRIANHHLDRFLIGSFLGVVNLGIYSIAAKVNRVAISVLQDSLSSVGLATFSRTRGDPARLGEAFYGSQRISAAVTLPFFVLLILTADSLVPLLLGPQWQASVPVLQALCLASCAGSIGVFNNPLLLAIGRPDIALRVSLLNVLTGLLAFFIAARWGVLGVSLAFALRAWLMLPLEFALCRRFGKLPPGAIWTGLTRQLLRLAPMVFAVVLVPPLAFDWRPWPVLVATLLLGAVCYAITLGLTEPGLLAWLRRAPVAPRAGKKQ